ncbi:MAG TPA: hypothetical protein VNM24_12170 [Burkholderiales bacterium]|jgi:hypothetical protein|nr:hypothetical protein [Burkholderiales bacterium]
MGSGTLFPPLKSFESRRAAVWVANRPWIAASVLVACAAVLILRSAGAGDELTWALLVAAAVLCTFTAVRIVRALNGLYRCPECGTLPYQTVTDYKCGGLGPTRADFMSPTVCPKCGARLR